MVGYQFGRFWGSYQRSSHPRYRVEVLTPLKRQGESDAEFARHLFLMQSYADALQLAPRAPWSYTEIQSAEGRATR